MEFKNDCDYSVTVFSQNGFLVKVQYVHDLHALCRWLDESRKYNSWSAINVYARRSRRFISQFKKGYPLPAKPR